MSTIITGATRRAITPPLEHFRRSPTPPVDPENLVGSIQQVTDTYQKRAQRLIDDKIQRELGPYIQQVYAKAKGEAEQRAVSLWQAAKNPPQASPVHHSLPPIASFGRDPSLSTPSEQTFAGVFANTHSHTLPQRSHHGTYSEASTLTTAPTPFYRETTQQPAPIMGTVESAVVSSTPETTSPQTLFQHFNTTDKLPTAVIKAEASSPVAKAPRKPKNKRTANTMLGEDANTASSSRPSKQRSISKTPYQPQ